MELRAPPPDFRYVGLRETRAVPGRSGVFWATAAGSAGATVATALLPSVGLRALSFGIACVAGLTAMVNSVPLRHGPSLAMVPWGVLIDSPDGRRAVRWAAVKNVEMDIVHGREDLVPTTRYTVVRVAIDDRTHVGYVSGGAPLYQLVAHLRAYAAEQSAPIALDLAGQRPLDRTEAQVEPLIAAARDWLGSGEAHDRLSLPGGNYREASARAASPETVSQLRDVLTGKQREPADRRPFAAIVAGELRATELVDDLVPLVSSPHPLVAAIARAATLRLGGGAARAGSFEEIAPFVREDDLAALEAWSIPPKP